MTETIKTSGQAAIIHSRTRYRDYREGLLVCPSDMTREEVYQWKQRLLCCTENPEEMREGHLVRRAVICDGVYAVAGVAAYFRDLYSGSFEDEGRRPVHGFVGFAWKVDSPYLSACSRRFPSRQELGRLVETYVIPRWEEPKNGRDAEKATLSDYREGWFGGAAGESVSDLEQPEESACVRQAMEQACRGEWVFYCEGVESLPAGPPVCGTVRMEPGCVESHFKEKTVKKGGGIVWIAAAVGIFFGAMALAFLFR